MKKLLAFILSVLYISSSMGASINMQYCCGKLIHVALSMDSTSPSFEASHWSSKKNIVTKDCCKEVYQHFKISHYQNTTPDISVPLVYFFMANLPLPIAIPTIYFASISEGNFSPHSPPFHERTPLYLKNCTFLI